jgi:hypothetical protein
MANENVITASVYDNYWVSHHIPRSDTQYSWITASIHAGIDALVEGGPYPPSASTFGHAPASGYVSSSFLDINGARVYANLPAYNFVSASDAGIHKSSQKNYYGYPQKASAEFIPNDFVGLNSNIYEPVSSSDNVLGFPLGSFEGLGPANLNALGAYSYQGGLVVSASSDSYRKGLAKVLNGILLHRNGPYQHPSWKQIRTGNHPIARKHRKTNILSVQDIPREIKVVESNVSYTATPLRAPTFTQYNEPPATSKFMPVDHNIKQTGDLVPHWYRYTHGNNMNMFSYNNLNDRLGLFYEGGTIYDEFFNVYKNSDENNPVEEFIGLNYKEIVYPREINTFLSGSRKRNNFSANFWKTTRSDRNQTGQTNSQEYAAGDASVWPLDARNNFTTADSVGVNRSSVTTVNDASGELQNGYTIFHMGNSCADSQLGDNASLTINNFASTADGRNLDEYVEILTGSNTYRWLSQPNSGTLAGAARSIDGDYGDEVSENPIGDWASGSWSISAWFKTAAGSSDSLSTDAHQTILSKYQEDTSEKPYKVWISSANGTLRAKQAGTNMNTSINVADNLWHHLVYTVDGTHQHLWVDGTHKVTADVGALQNLTDATKVLIGAVYDTNNNPEEFFSGSIKHVSYWDLFLTASTAGSAVPGASASAGMIYDLYNGGCPTDLSQYQSSSILFDGSNDYLQIEKGNSVLSTRNDMRTYSFWIRCEQQADLAYLYYAADEEFIALNTNGTIAYELADVGGSSISTQATTVTVHDNQWHHIAVTTQAAASKDVRVFIDGVEAHDGALGTGYATTDIFIGAKSDGTNAFKGYIDEFSVWSTASTLAQVLELYATGSPQNLHNHSHANHMLAWYRMGDDPRDSVAGGNSASL